MKLNLVRATGNTRFVIAIASITSVFTYAASGAVLWKLAIAATIFNIVGSWLGAALAIKNGARIILPIMLCVAAGGVSIALQSVPREPISIFGKKPEDSLPLPPAEMGEYMEELVTSRRSCRRFLDKNVDPEIITRILSAMAAAPTGGNTQGVEYTVIDDKERVHEIWREAYAVMDAKAKRHIYTHSFSDFYYGKMKQSEKTVRKDDLLFCGAPHLFIAHEKCVGKWAEDSKVNCNIATACFELLCNAHGLGTTIMSYSAEVLNELAPKARDMLNIPREHYTGLIVGFGYPEIPYARGVQKDKSAKTHRYSQDKGKR